MNFKKTLQLTVLVGFLGTESNIPVYAKGAIVEKRELETRQAYSELKKDMELFIQEQRNISGESADRLRESASKLLASLSDASAARTDDVRADLERFLEHQKSAVGKAADKVREGSRSLLKNIKETATSATDATRDAADTVATKLSLATRKAALEKEELEARQAYNDVKKDLELFIAEQKNATGEAADRLRVSGSRLLTSLSDVSATRKDEIKANLEQFLEHQKNVASTNADKFRQSSGRLLTNLKEGTVSKAKAAGNAISNVAHAIYEKAKAAGHAVSDSVQTAGHAVSDSVTAIRETHFVGRTTSSDNERAGLTANNPQRYRIEIVFPGFEISELNVVDHFQESKPWIEIIGEHATRPIEHTHGFENSFFNLKKRVVQRTLPSFVDVSQGKYVKFLEGGVVVFEFEIKAKDRSNPNLLGLDTERISVQS